MFINIPNIIILTETWLVNKISNQELNLPNYLIYRSDRVSNSNNSNINEATDAVDVRGGGVLIAVDRSFHSSNIAAHLIPPASRDLEQLFIKVSFNKTKCIFGSIYIPPNSSCEVYQKHIDCMENISKFYIDHDFYIFGDFNLRKISWGFDHGLQYSFQEGSSAAAQQAASLIGNFYSMLNLKQFYPTR